MKKVMLGVIIAAVALSASAKIKKPVAMAGSDEGPVTTGNAAKVTIDQTPRLGKQCCLAAPALNGASNIGTCYTKPRNWIVPEVKYTTFVRTMPQLTFTWHMILDVTRATNKDPALLKKLSPYSYFTTSVTYYNIPMGSHAASVCLHPSYLETYGEPCAIGLVISNENGDILGGDTWATGNIAKFVKGKQFWNDNTIMDAKQAGGDLPMIERRQGLVDRSKTIWALVNPNDYENVMQ